VDVDELQTNLLSPTGAVMLRALLRQSETRVTKLERYLQSEQTFRLFTEHSLFCLVLDQYERSIAALPEYRDAQLVSGVLPIKGAMEALSASRWLPGGAARRGGRRERRPRLV
jgi:hypothetical protein